MIVVFEPGLNAVERQGCNTLPNLFAMLKTQTLANLLLFFFPPLFPWNDRFHSWDAEQNAAPPDCDSTHSWLRHPHAALIAPRQDKLEKTTRQNLFFMHSVFTEQARVAPVLQLRM